MYLYIIYNQSGDYEQLFLMIVGTCIFLFIIIFSHLKKWGSIYNAMMPESKECINNLTNLNGITD